MLGWLYAGIQYVLDTKFTTKCTCNLESNKEKREDMVYEFHFIDFAQNS